ncbi:hypothetical protein M8J75_005991 [Diaphorina citri]|nr:hypothetical protein M8J75_005991 [Diaphorina citri]
MDDKAARHACSAFHHELLASMNLHLVMIVMIFYSYKETQAEHQDVNLDLELSGEFDEFELTFSELSVSRRIFFHVKLRLRNLKI